MKYLLFLFIVLIATCGEKPKPTPKPTDTELTRRIDYILSSVDMKTNPIDLFNKDANDNNYAVTDTLPWDVYTYEIKGKDVIFYGKNLSEIKYVSIGFEKYDISERDSSFIKVTYSGWQENQYLPIYFGYGTQSYQLTERFASIKKNMPQLRNCKTFYGSVKVKGRNRKYAQFRCDLTDTIPVFAYPPVAYIGKQYIPNKHLKFKGTSVEGIFAKPRAFGEEQSPIMLLLGNGLKIKSTKGVSVNKKYKKRR